MNCESDFVARTEDFKALVNAVALQVAGAAPKYVAKEDMPAGSEDDPKVVCLLEQDYIKDPSKTMDDMLKATIAKTGENIRIKRFARFELGANERAPLNLKHSKPVHPEALEGHAPRRRTVTARRHRARVQRPVTPPLIVEGSPGSFVLGHDSDR